jgi:hypothetical protein
MLIGTFLFKWGGEYPGKVCDIGFETFCIFSPYLINSRIFEKKVIEQKIV